MKQAKGGLRLLGFGALLAGPWRLAFGCNLTVLSKAEGKGEKDKACQSRACHTQLAESLQ